MNIQYFGPLAAAVFVLQFILCMKKVKLPLRLLPVAALVLGIAGCAIAAFVEPGGYAAPIIGALLAMLLALDGIAWIAAFFAEKYKK